MTTRSVQQKIRTATENKIVSYAEARTIAREVEKGRVTKGELKAVEDLMDRTKAQCADIGRGGSPLCAPPELQMGARAKNTLTLLIERHKPSGVDAVKAALDHGALWTMFSALGVTLSRSHTVALGDIAARPDGNFDVEIKAHHWRDPSQMNISRRVVVDADGKLV